MESLARKLPPGSTDIPSPQLVPERSSGTYSSDLKGSKGSIPYRKWSSTPSEVLQSDIAAKEPEKGTVGFVLQEDAVSHTMTLLDLLTDGLLGSFSLHR